ncbi:MAG: thrombospondin type 3 repeat-containing protein [Phycisphaerales bacterium]|nr:thrombospondin type 3 repeat-containing protein [Phycisphaerales bacterium]
MKLVAFNYNFCLIGIWIAVVTLKSTGADADCTDPHLEWQAEVEPLEPNPEMIPHGLAVGPEGEVFVVGQFRRLFDFDPSEHGSDNHDSITPAMLNRWSPMDMFVTRLEADGSYGWTHTDGFDWADGALGVAIDPADEVDPVTYVIVAGYYEFFLSIGLGPSDGRDAFVVKFPIDGSFGFPVWARSFGDDSLGLGDGAESSNGAHVSGGDAATAVAVDPADGSVIVGLNDGWVIRLNADGSDCWSQQVGDLPIEDLAIDAFGDVLALCGHGPIRKLAAADGSAVWTVAVPGATFEDIAVDASGSGLFVTGAYKGIVDFDPGPGEDIRASMVKFFGVSELEFTNDVFVTRLDADGRYVWTWTVGGHNEDRACSVSSDLVTGSVTIAGRFGGGFTNFNPNGEPDIRSDAGAFATRLQADGNYIWTHLSSVRDEYNLIAVAADESGGVALSESNHVTSSGAFSFATQLLCDFPADDLDGDGVLDKVDNCPKRFNPAPQLDADGDGVGDVCDICSAFDDAIDNDADGIADDCDNCPDTSNALQLDTNRDGVGDICDDDSDGIRNLVDKCPQTPSQNQQDFDEDGVGDVCDNCFAVPNVAQSDFDQDALGDLCDACPGNRGVVVYWSDSGGRWVKSKETSPTLGCEELRLSGLAAPVGIFADPAESKLYWVDASLDVIRRSDLVGLNVEDVVTTGLDRPQSLVVFDSKVYWTDWGLDRITRANLDGSDIEVIRDGASNPYGLAIDVVGRKLYWSETDFQTGAIRRCELDGAAPELVFGNLPAVTGIAIDDVGEQLFWVNWGDPRLQTASLSGGIPETLYLVGDFTESLSLFRDSLYWTDSQGDVFRADADGLGVVERVVEGAQDPRSVAVVAFGGAPGDCNGSGSVTLDDVPCFVTALLGDGSGFTAADIDGNGIVDGRDLQPFVSLLLP